MERSIFVWLQLADEDELQRIFARATTESGGLLQGVGLSSQESVISKAAVSYCINNKGPNAGCKAQSCWLDPR